MMGELRRERGSAEGRDSMQTRVLGRPPFGPRRSPASFKPNERVNLVNVTVKGGLEGGKNEIQRLWTQQDALGGNSQRQVWC